MLGILTILLVVNFASASDLRFNQTSFGSSTYNVKQGSSATFTVLLSNLNDTYSATDISINGATASIPNIANNSNQTFSFTIDIPSNEVLGNKVYTIDATGILNGSTIHSVNNISVIINIIQSEENRIVTELCGSSYNSSEISFSDLEDKTKDNKDEWNWEPLNNIELKLNDVYNHDLNKDRDYEVSLNFYRSDGTKLSSDKMATSEDDLVQDVSINSDDSESVTFNFQVDGQVKEDTYDIYAKVKRSGVCYVKKVAETDITKDDYRVVINSIDAPVTASCGDIVTLNAQVANVGSSDEDKVKVNIYNRELGINTYQELFDLAEGDTTTVSFSFAIPGSATQGNHKIELSTEYKYDKNKDTYKKTESNDDKIYTLGLSDGCIDSTRPTIAAKLDTDAIISKPMNITISLKNNGASTMAALLSAGGFDSWAKMSSINASTLSLAKGETKTVVLTLIPTKEGQQTFKINVLYDGKTISQDVIVNVAKKTGFLSSVFSEANSTTYLITGIIILVILIVVVLVVKLILSRRA